MSRTALLFAVVLILALACLLAHLRTPLTEAHAVATSEHGDPRLPVHRSTARVLVQTDAHVELRLTHEPDVALEADSALEPDPAVAGAERSAAASGEGIHAVRYAAPGGARASVEGRVWEATSTDAGPFSVLVRVHDRGAVETRIESFELVRSDGTSVPAPVDFDPSGLLEISEPAIMRDLRVVTLAFAPGLAGLPAGTSVGSVDVSIEPGVGRGVNEKTAHHRIVSPAFHRLYQAEVINYDGRDVLGASAGWPASGAVALDGRDPPPDGARYLVIAADAYVEAVQPLVDWKTLKGMLAKLTTLSEIGSTPEEIRSYIETAYTTWELPPEFVLLVGDTELLPGYQSLSYTDNYFATLEGSDYLADIMVGRFSVDTVLECETMVAKTMGYERTPLIDDANWPGSGLLIVFDDYDAGDAIYYGNTWFIYDLMDAAGVAPIDTLFRKNGVDYDDFFASMNAGKGFVNYRGQAWQYWIPPFNVPAEYFDNGWRQPVVVSATCGTGIYQADEFMGENWVRGGTPEDPKGCVAYFATNTGHESSEKWSLRRGYVDEGFFANAFGEDGWLLGEACLAGKLNLHEISPDTSEYEGWNLLGDPELNLWTGVPGHLTVLHDEGVQIGQPELPVTVLLGGEAVEGALVSCVGDTDLYVWGHTGPTGYVTLPIAPAAPGSLSVTVTARNGYPYEGSAYVLESGPFVVFSECSLDDGSGGNGDGLLAPGESVELEVALSNIGNALAESVVATLRTSDAHVTVTDSTAAFGDIGADVTAWGVDGFAFSLSPECPSGSVVRFTLALSYGTSSAVRYPPPLEVVTGRLEFVGTGFEDPPPGGNGDQAPGAGEAVALIVSLSNDGQGDLTSIEGTITATDPFVVVTTSRAEFSDAATGGGCTNGDHPFMLSISPAAPDGHECSLSLALSADGHSYAHAESLGFEIALVNPSFAGPTGPDAYGYYAYDVTDTIYDAVPVFEWCDIAPPGPGNIMTEITDSDAAITTFTTLFPVKYYGTTYGDVSVNSNGFLTMGYSDYLYGDNSPIPDEHGPAKMIAPFWDDLDPSAGGDIYRWLDTANHRWIIQFDEVRHWGSTDAETFQVIILNQSFYPTPTGDAEILVQYLDVTDPTACTVGIEDVTQNDGIGWAYDGTYGSQALPIADETAILYTTVPPGEPEIPWLVLAGVTIDDAAGGNGDGVAQPGETIAIGLDVENEGGRDALGVSVSLSSDEGTVSIADGTAAIPDIPAGGADQNSDPLVLSISGAIDDTVATLWAAFEANGGAYGTTARIDLHIDLSQTGTGDDVIPSAFRFHPCYPNPFARDAAMRLALPAATRVTVRIYSPAGRLVRTLVDAPLEAGVHPLVWDGADGSGRRVASGVYFVRVEAGRETASRKVVFLR